MELDFSLEWLAGLPSRDPEVLDPYEKELLSLYHDLPEEERPIALEMLKVFSGRSKGSRKGS